MTENAYPTSALLAPRAASAALQLKAILAIERCWASALKPIDVLVLQRLCHIAHGRASTGFVAPIHALVTVGLDGGPPLGISAGRLKKSLRWLAYLGLIALRPAAAGTTFLIDFDRILAAEESDLTPDEAIKAALLRQEVWDDLPLA